MNRWEVEFRNGKISRDAENVQKQVKTALDRWVSVARTSGPVGLLAIRGYEDKYVKALKPLRRSRLGKGYRVFYYCFHEERVFEIQDVNNHDYRKKR